MLAAYENIVAVSKRQQPLRVRTREAQALAPADELLLNAIGETLEALGEVAEIVDFQAKTRTEIVDVDDALSAKIADAAGTTLAKVRPILEEALGEGMREPSELAFYLAAAFARDASGFDPANLRIVADRIRALFAA